VAKEFEKYNIEIAAVCETLLAFSGSLIGGGYTFFWNSGEQDKRKTRVRFAITNSIAVKLNKVPMLDRTMPLPLPLQIWMFACLFQRLCSHHDRLWRNQRSFL